MESSVSWVDSAQRSLVERFRAGLRRVRDGFVQSLQIVVAGVGAYSFAEKVLGHHEPIFAATAAIVSLGFVTGSTHTRRILEVSLGVTLGILVGDLLMLALGRGTWQAALVLFVSILLARFLDKGILFTIQMGVQSCLVVLMAPSPDGTFARSLDGIVGGLCAFLMMFIFPKDPRREPRRKLVALMSAYADSLRNSASALVHYDADEAWDSLVTARRLQPLYAAASGDIVTAKGLARLSAVGRRRGEELEEFSRVLSGLDLAIRNTRVFDRRLSSTIRNVQLSDAAVQSLSDTLLKLSDGVKRLEDAVSASEPLERVRFREEARRIFAEVAGVLEPSQMGVRSLEGESLVLMLRPLVVDLLEVSGLSNEETVEVLVPLGESMTEHAPITSMISVVRPETAGLRKLVLPEDEERLRADTRALNTVLRAKPANAPKTSSVPRVEP